jgi:osmotically-inducible protein OsmY
MTSKAANRNLRQHVLDELDWEPQIDSAHIGAAVKDGIVTLSGHVPTYAQKRAAERAVLRVDGVKGIANEIAVQLPTRHAYTDAELADAAVRAIAWNTHVPDGAVKVKVENGWISLSGTVDWNYQRRQAERAVRSLKGVREVSNLIQVTPSARPTDIHAKIKQALARRADEDAERITVTVDGSEVTLKGTVDSWTDRDSVEEAAWSAPGVTDVHNKLTVSRRSFA